MFHSRSDDIKDKIRRMIEQRMFAPALAIAADYHEICPEDDDYFSIMACLSMASGDLAEAEKHVVEGLQRAGRDNHDLLFNLYQLKDLSGKDEEAYQIGVEMKLRQFGEPLELNRPAADNVRIMHGTMEIANQMRTLSEGLNKKGMESKTVSYYPNYLNYAADCVYDLRKMSNPASDIKELAARYISEFDIFHYHYGTSLTLDYSDLPVLKDMGKTVLMHHWGSDIRILSQARAINPYIKVKTSDEAAIRGMLANLSRYIDHGIVADYELYIYIKDYYKNIHFIPQAIDLEKYPYFPTEKKNKLLLVHAPTNPEFKGSKHIIDALEKLKPHYDFEFKLIQGMAHDEAKKWYSKADLIVDQILCGSYGLLAIECMAMGKPVVSWLTDYIMEYYPKELPLLSANPDTIESVLREALDNQDQFAAIGKRGRAYVEKYHDINVVSGQLVELYKHIRK